jgi:6-phospho-3-hexuloisomerase
MVTVRKSMDTIIREAVALASAVDGASAETLVDMLLDARRIVAAGTGRSGYMMNAFAMRLCHLGLTAYAVGDAGTPPLRAGDILVVGSASGETEAGVAYATRAKHAGARVAIITARRRSSLSALAELAIILPAPARRGAGRGKTVASAQPVGSLFEQGLFLVTEAIIMTLMTRRGQTPRDLLARHTNLA